MDEVNKENNLNSLIRIHIYVLPYIKFYEVSKLMVICKGKKNYCFTIFY